MSSLAQHYGLRVLLIAVMLIAGLPAAEVHPEGEGAPVSIAFVDQDPLHTPDTLPSGDGDHVHLHQCCPHLQAVPAIELAARRWADVHLTITETGELLAGNPNTPFRPPAV